MADWEIDLLMDAEMAEGEEGTGYWYAKGIIAMPNATQM